MAKEWTPPEKLEPCPYHPDVQMVWRRKHTGKTRKSKLWWFQCCDECEWNPPDIPSFNDVGRTSPDVKRPILDDE